MRLKHVAAALGCLFLLACGQGGGLIPSDQSAFVERFVALFPAHDTDSIQKLMAPSTDPATVRHQIEAMIAIYPKKKLLNVEVAHWREFKSLMPGRNMTSTLQVVYHFAGDDDLLATVSLQGTSTGYVVTSAFFKPLPAYLKQSNNFHLQNGPWQDSTIVILAIIAVLVSLYALITCIRTRGLPRKWLWIVFILFGVGKLTVNWTTGELAFQLLSVQLFSAGSARFSEYNPWFISVSLPLGAWVFLARRKKLIEATREEIADKFGLPSSDGL